MWVLEYTKNNTQNPCCHICDFFTQVKLSGGSKNAASSVINFKLMIMVWIMDKGENTVGPL